jgi:hypothetical protein
MHIYLYIYACIYINIYIYIYIYMYLSVNEYLSIYMKELYRRAFTDPSIRNILSRCGHIFVAGEGESGELTAQMLNQRDVDSMDEEEVHREQLQVLIHI